MRSTTRSFIIRCWSDQQTGERRVEMVRVETEVAVPVATNSFLMRFTRSDDGHIERCYIKHIASGREAYMQGGPGLGQFIAEYMLE